MLWCVGLLVSMAIVAAADLRDEMVAFLCQDNDDLVARQRQDRMLLSDHSVG
jgi:hypothetical protein